MRSSCRSAPRAASCPKRLPDRATAAKPIQAEGVRVYKRFISSLLDLTDNLEGRQGCAAADTVRRDGDDPYLVVAADKGTATFSDIANGISRRAWLLARRCLRLRGLRRLRPQEDGDHRARRVGGGQAAFPRDRYRHPDDTLHGDRRRRHVGRRVRQWHAVVARRSGFSPLSTIATFSSTPIPIRQASFEERRAAVRSAALELAGL